MNVSAEIHLSAMLWDIRERSPHDITFETESLIRYVTKHLLKLLFSSNYLQIFKLHSLWSDLGLFCEVLDYNPAISGMLMREKDAVNKQVMHRHKESFKSADVTHPCNTKQNIFRNFKLVYIHNDLLKAEKFYRGPIIAIHVKILEVRWKEKQPVTVNSLVQYNNIICSCNSTLIFQKVVDHSLLPGLVRFLRYTPQNILLSIKHRNLSSSSKDIEGLILMLYI